ncbi:hypothetical protein HN803_04595 [candidate division WWE3 bacterium]|jgi:hypothetical protein|nr:hypothetical protein [Candidatus Scalindua sp.]MBT7350042.1 hypothetical protein [candidate division WWE3 bacterium]
MRKLSDQQKIDIVSEYLRGKSCGEIAKTSPVNRSSVRCVLLARGVKLRKRKREFDQKYFDNIDSEDKAYWLGFIVADGSIYLKTYTLSIQLGEKSRDHLIKFAKCVGYKYHDDYNKKKNAFRIRLNSKHMAKSLGELGIIENKTDFIQVPDLRNDLLKHFFRGFFDGDGCIKSKKIECRTDWTIEASSNCRDFIYCVKDWINKQIGEEFGSIYEGTSKKYQTIYYKLIFNGNTKSLLVASLLYNDNKISLDQKQLRFDKMVEYNKNRIPNKWGK